jgi:hypothetical protein
MGCFAFACLRLLKNGVRRVSNKRDYRVCAEDYSEPNDGPEHMLLPLRALLLVISVLDIHHDAEYKIQKREYPKERNHRRDDVFNNLADE